MIDATLHFDEARAKEISLAAGFGSYQGFITRVDLCGPQSVRQSLGIQLRHSN